MDLKTTSLFPSGILNIPTKMPGKVEDVCSNGWLDAMKSSSPRRNDSDAAYFSWMLKYPSALSSFDQITDYAKYKKIVIFLDYDGTLSPIVDDPDLAFMSDDMRCTVRNVAEYFPTAVISGRSRDKVYELVGLSELYYAGSHGMDIISSHQQGKEVILFQPASEFLTMIGEVFRTIVESIKDIKGAQFENHTFCASVHYRNVDEKCWPTIAQRVHDILRNYPRLRLTHGRKVLEVRPAIDWDKGKAVEFLLESLGLHGSENLLPIYIGDDRTDEDAFKVLREGNQGFGILVSSIPKETNAFFSLKDPFEVLLYTYIYCSSILNSFDTVMVSFSLAQYSNDHNFGYGCPIEDRDPIPESSHRSPRRGNGNYDVDYFFDLTNMF